MVKVTFTSALKQFFPDLSAQELEGASIKELITSIESIYPGMQDYLLEEDGSLRKHVNIFVPAKNLKVHQGFIIMEPEHTFPMSGSNSICVSTVLLVTGMIEMNEQLTEFVL